MDKILSVNSAFAFVTAVSGVFITLDNPSGLTKREREVVAALLDIINDGTINPRIQKKLWQQFKETVNLRTQSMSNMMGALKDKRVVNFHNGVYSLHPVLKKGEGLTLKYEP